MKKEVKRSVAAVLAVVAITGSSATVAAAPATMPDGTVFDAEFYAANNPDVVAVYGTDTAALYQHYVDYGKAEGRAPVSDAVPAQGESNVALNNGKKAAAKSGSVKDLINSAPLTPIWPQTKELNDLISQIFEQIITEDMTTYDKVKACYDWLIVNTEYGLSNNAILRTMPYDDFKAYDVLSSHYGVCDHYSAAFEKMVKAIGLDCHVQGGLTHKADGGYTPHAWTVIVIDGNEFVFDPQLEDSLAKGGSIGYYRFGKTYAEVPDKYIVE